MVVHYLVEERTSESTGKIIYSTNRMSQKNLGTKKAVTQLKTASALCRLMALSDGNLYLLDSDMLNTIGSGPKIKNVTVFCVNENPNTLDPFTVQLCVGKRRCIQFCSLHEDRVSFLRELSTHEPVNIAMDGNYVCVAGQGQYCVFNVEAATRQDLFPYDMATTYPHVKRIAKEEFLLAGPGNLGMFVTAAGISERPPIQWSEGITALSYYHPYIITVTSQFIRVYSLIDQQHKQTINFSGGELVGNFDGQLYVAANSCVSCLMPQPWTMQVEALMDSERVEEAVELAEHSGAVGMSQEQYQQLCRTLLQRAGFIKLAHGVFDQAQEYFLKGAVDVREVISLFPGLLPAAVEFTRVQPPMHHLADISQAMQGDQARIKAAKTFLLSFLLHLRFQGHLTHRMEVDTAIIKLQAEGDSSDLLLFLDHSDIACNLPECTQWLTDHKQFSALAKLHRVLGNLEKSLEVLTKLVREEVTDKHFQGVKDLVDCLVLATDTNVVWRYADFVLDRDSSEGVRVFTETQAALDPSRVLHTLQRYPEARLGFLHHLIDTKKLQDEKYHTELVLHYVDEAVRLMDAGDAAQRDQLNETRAKLQDLLNSSSHYQAHPVLARLQGTNLHVETAAVFGRLGEHEKALSMLVHQLKDFSAAEQYCIAQSRVATSSSAKSNIFLKLLKIYLRPPPGCSEDDIELVPAIELLSVHAEELDVSSVLALLPPTWSLAIIHHYLRAALRNSLHQSRIKRIQQTLLRSENLQQKFVLYKLSKDMGPIPLAANRVCCVCNRGFTSCSFTIYPNGVMAHPSCAPNPSVCPLTGTVFQAAHNSPTSPAPAHQYRL
ncbi:transforming growth factor-beta receptor-associated protein 1-like isoform X2 [Scylla paramamosain]